MIDNIQDWEEIGQLLEPFLPTPSCPSCGRPPAANIRQYMTRPIACEKDVSKPKPPDPDPHDFVPDPETLKPFPSILESAEQKRRVERNRAKREIATLRANFADWIWSQTEPKPAGSK